MPDLRQQLERSLRGRVCFLGLGNPAQGDDGFGVRLAEELQAAGVPDVVIAETTPERWIGQLAEFDHVVFLDAVDCGGAAGSTVFLNSEEMAVRFPQISTHKISLGVLAKWVAANGTTKVWLLGAQPESLRPSRGLTPTVQTTLDLLSGMLCSLSGTSQLAGVQP